MSAFHRLCLLCLYVVLEGSKRPTPISQKRKKKKKKCQLQSPKLLRRSGTLKRLKVTVAYRLHVFQKESVSKGSDKASPYNNPSTFRLNVTVTFCLPFSLANESFAPFVRSINRLFFFPAAGTVTFNLQPTTCSHVTIILYEGGRSFELLPIKRNQDKQHRHIH